MSLVLYQKSVNAQGELELIPIRLVADGDGAYSVSTTAALDPGDINIGAVEVKDAETTSRMAVSTRGDAKVADDYAGGQVLAEQAGANGVLTFTFASAVQLVVVEAYATGATPDTDLVSRADPFGGTPTASLGVPCRDQIPVFLPITATTVKVYTPTGMSVNVWGYRRG